MSGSRRSSPEISKGWCSVYLLPFYLHIPQGRGRHYNQSALPQCKPIVGPWPQRHESDSRWVVSDFLRPHGLYSPWNSLGQNTGVSSLSLLQGLFPTQGSNPGLPPCRQILYQLNNKRTPRILEWAGYPFSSGSSWPRNWTRVSCIANGLQAHFQLSYQTSPIEDMMELRSAPQRCPQP